MFNRKAVFLDRDGTLIEIVERPEHIKKRTAPFKESELVFVPDVHEALDILRRAGFLRIMVTNQPDVAHGYMEEEEWKKIHRAIVSSLDFDDVFMCRHRQGDGCPFKKPSGLMLQSAADKWGINLSKSYMVGDTYADSESGKLAGCETILVDRFYNQDAVCDVRVGNLMDAVKVIVMAEKMT